MTRKQVQELARKLRTQREGAREREWTRVISIKVCRGYVSGEAGDVLFRRVRASLSQKLIVPSEPQVENVP